MRKSTILSAQFHSQPSSDNCDRYDMYKDIEESIAVRKGVLPEGKFIRGLPVGLKLPNGVTIGENDTSALRSSL